MSAEHHALLVRSLRGSRRWRIAGAAAFLVPGVVGLAIAILAARGGERVLLAGTFLLVAVLPGWLLWRRVTPPIPEDPVYVALTHAPERIHAITIGYSEGLRGFSGCVTVHLLDGTRRGVFGTEQQAKGFAAWVEELRSRAPGADTPAG